MGEFSKRLDKGPYLVAKLLLETWFAEFVVEYSEAEDKHEVVVKWFGDATKEG